MVVRAFITVKGNSSRCPGKNIKLLPYVLDQCKDLFNITVITDSLDIENICKEYNIDCFIEDRSIQTCEFNSIYQYLKITGEVLSEFIHIPVTQPIRNEETLLKIRDMELGEYDFITTYSIISNRKIFLLDEDKNFIYESYERKGSLCKDSKMVDGALYKISYNCLGRVIKSENINHAFWNKSKIKFIENTTGLFLDVDEPRDLRLFEIYKKPKGEI